jgi:Cu/Ag efflux protein CusF
MTAVALALAAGAASAAEWTGTIEEIDEVAGRIVVSDETRPDQQRVFAVSDANTVGPTLDELREGDKVSVFFADDQAGSGQPINAMTIEKVAETGDAAMTGDTAEWEGAVEQVDQSAGTVTVDGQEFAVDQTAAVGVALDELQPGDQVRIVYHDAGTGRMEVVELTRVQ